MARLRFVRNQVAGESGSEALVGPPPGATTAAWGPWTWQPVRGQWPTRCGRGSRPGGGSDVRSGLRCLRGEIDPQRLVPRPLPGPLHRCERCLLGWLACPPAGRVRRQSPVMSEAAGRRPLIRSLLGSSPSGGWRYGAAGPESPRGWRVSFPSPAGSNFADGSRHRGRGLFRPWPVTCSMAEIEPVPTEAGAPERWRPVASQARQRSGSARIWRRR